MSSTRSLIGHPLSAIRHLISVLIFALGVLAVPSICFALNGDVNLDGAVNKADVDILSNFLVGKSTFVASPLNADVNHDNVLDANDALMLLQFVNGLRSFLPVTGSSTSISGNISGTLSPNGTVYVAEGDLTVPAGQTLTLSPGVVLKMGLGTSLIVDGMLQSLGVSTNPVIITSINDDSILGDTNGDGNATLPDYGDWNGIHMNQTAASDVLQYTTIIYGGGSAAMVSVTGANLAITGSQIKWSYSDGLSLAGQSHVTVANTNFQECGNGYYNGVCIDAGTNSGSSLTVDRSTFTACDAAIGVDPGASFSFTNSLITQSQIADAIELHPITLTHAVTLPVLSAPYIFLFDWVVDSGGQLTLPPGTRLGSWYSSLRMQNGGQLVALGTSTRPILLTSVFSFPPYNTDGRGQGDWGGLQFFNSSPSQLSYVQIADGGLNDSLINVVGSSFSIDNSTISSSLTNGIIASAQAQVTVSSCNFQFDLGVDIDLAGQSKLTMTNSYIGEGFPGGVQADGSQVQMSNSQINTYGNDALTLTGASQAVLQSCIFQGNNRGINLARSSMADVRGCTLQNNGEGIYSDSASTISIQQSVISDSWGSGIDLVARSHADLKGCTLQNNNDDGIRIDGGSMVSIQQSIISGNYDSGVTNNDNTVTLDATNDYWGSPDGPTNPENPDGTGDAVVGNVNFVPFWTSPSGGAPPNITYLSGNVSGTLSASANVYVATGSLTVPDGQTLTLQAGLVIKMSTGTAFTVNGTLVSQGTTASPVYITSLADDSILGDTGDDGPSQGAPGQWSGLSFNNSVSSTQLTGTTIRFGRQITLANASPQLNNVTISSMSNVAIAADLKSWPTGSGNRAFGSPLNGIDLSSGTVVSPTFMNGLGIPYVVRSGTVFFDARAPLTMAPGAVVKSWGDGWLEIDSLLTVLGNSDAPVVFTSLRDDSVGGDTNLFEGYVVPSSGDWTTVFLYGAGSSGSRLSHAIFRYGGNIHWEELGIQSSTGTLVDNCEFSSSSADGIWTYDADGLRIRNSTFTANGWGGADLSGAESSINSSFIEGNVFDGNSEGIYFYGGAGTSVLKNNLFKNNALVISINDPNIFIDDQGGNVLGPNNYYAAIEVFGGTWNETGGTLTQGATWTQGGTWNSKTIPYLIDFGSVTFQSGAPLTLGEGVVVKFDEGYGLALNMKAPLYVNGTSSAPVVFTSAYDDSVGGVTVGYSGSIDPYPGDWGAVVLDGAGSSGSQLSHAVFRYGGAVDGADLYISSSTGVEVNACRFSSSVFDGIQMKNSAANISNAAIISNGRYGLNADAASSPVIHTSIFQGNGTGGLINNGGTAAIDATNNYWGSPTGPRNANNPGGAGDIVSGNVNFTPFLTAAPF